MRTFRHLRHLHIVEVVLVDSLEDENQEKKEKKGITFGNYLPNLFQLNGVLVKKEKLLNRILISGSLNEILKHKEELNNDPSITLLNITKCL